MKRSINKVAVLGSGVMGSRIACHFANIGVQVLLLDIVPKDADTTKKSRNKIVDDALAFALKSNPSPIYKKSPLKGTSYFISGFNHLNRKAFSTSTGAAGVGIAEIKSFAI